MKEMVLIFKQADTSAEKLAVLLENDDMDIQGLAGLQPTADAVKQQVLTL